MARQGMIWQGLLLAVGLALYPVAGQAAWPAPDVPGQYRMIGPAGSGAAGSNAVACDSEPLCAVATLLACFSRRDEALCRAVWPGMAPGRLFGAAQANQAYWWSWRLEAVHVLGDGQAELAVAGRHCGLLSRGTPLCLTKPAPATLYRVAWSQDAKAWRVLDWRSPTGSEGN